MPKKKYRWTDAHAWLHDFGQRAVANNDVTELWNIIDALMWRLSDDDIQDLFQSDMAHDGYFVEVNDA